MNKILKQLTKECYETDLDYFYKKVGNYKIKRNGEKIVHYYYGYPICIVYLWRKDFYLDCGGYSKYVLTTAQLNFLEKYYKDKGYKLVERI